MASKNKLYVVTMYRWADREKHSYVHGVFDNERSAKKAADAEQVFRGGNKYYPEILEFEANNIKSRKVTLALGE